MSQIGAGAEAEPRVTAMDTHPPLAQRVAALEKLPATAASLPDTRPAATLLGNADGLARALLQFASGQDAVQRLQDISWRDVPTAVFVERWRRTAEVLAEPLGSFTVDAPPIGEHAFVDAGRAVTPPGRSRINDREEAMRWGMHGLSCALGAVVLEEGWTVETAPGEPLVFVRGAERLEAFARVSAAAAGALNPDEWRAECGRLGLTGRSLRVGEGVAAV
jgi:hypothetical protein